MHVSDINWTNPDSKTQTHTGGETCLMRAVHGDWQNPRKYQVIEFLLSQPRHEVNKQAYSGATALVYALDAADSQAARLIMAHPSADPTIRTWPGQCSGGGQAGKCALDLVDRILIHGTTPLCNEMREVFGLPKLLPPLRLWRRRSRHQLYQMVTG